MKPVQELDKAQLIGAIKALELVFPDNAVVIILGDDKGCVVMCSLETEHAFRLVEGGLESLHFAMNKEVKPCH